MEHNPQTEIESEVIKLLEDENKLATLENELMQEERFRTFLQAQKTFQTESTLYWKSIEDQMINNNIKSIKGDWGSITIAERIGFDTTDELPSKFYKKVVDTKKLSDTYKLEGKAPKGATPKYTKYLTKRIK
jgi:hypothetical protein